MDAICIEDICPCAYWGVITSSLDPEGFAKTATFRSEKIARFSQNLEIFMKGAVLFNQPYLYLSGDPNFHMVMVEAGLMRGNAILSGLPHKAIMANKYEYWLVDYDDEMRFCEKYDLAACYSVEEFVSAIKNYRHENN